MSENKKEIDLKREEMEMIGHLYMEGRLSPIEEREFELVLLNSNHISPFLGELRKVIEISYCMDYSPIISESPRNSHFRSLIAAAVAVILSIAAFVTMIIPFTTKSNQVLLSIGHVEVVIDGKPLDDHSKALQLAYTALNKHKKNMEEAEKELSRYDHIMKKYNIKYPIE